MRQKLRSEANAEYGRIIFDALSQKIDLSLQERILGPREITHAHRAPHHDEQLVTFEVERQGIPAVKRAQIDLVPHAGDCVRDSSGALELLVRQNHSAFHGFPPVHAPRAAPIARIRSIFA
jgi:hypothetical protein